MILWWHINMLYLCGKIKLSILINGILSKAVFFGCKNNFINSLFSLQTYMREQPDNVKSFNIVGETAQFLNVVYSTVNSKTIALIIQLFSTLNEFCAVSICISLFVLKWLIVDMFKNYICTSSLLVNGSLDLTQSKVMVNNNVCVITIHMKILNITYKADMCYQYLAIVY